MFCGLMGLALAGVEAASGAIHLEWAAQTGHRRVKTALSARLKLCRLVDKLPIQAVCRSSRLRTH